MQTMDTILLPIIIGLNAVGLASAVGLLSPPRSATRLVAGAVFSLWLLAFAAFCAFGFMASFEPPIAEHRPWQIGYAIAGRLALAGAALAGRRAFRKA